MKMTYFSTPSENELRTLNSEVEKVDNYDYQLSLKVYPESIRQYISEIWKSHPRISEKELITLFIRMYDGDETARNKIVEANLRLVIYVALKYQMVSKMEIEDIIQEGNIGLIEAIYNFDITRGYKFSTFAFWYIKGYILRAITEKCRTIRFPAYIYEKSKKLEDASMDFYTKNGEHLSVKELSELTGIPEKTIYEIKRVNSLLSLDEPHEYSSDLDDKELPFSLSLIDCVKDDSEDIFDIVYQKEAEERIKEALRRTLTPREELVFVAYLEQRKLEDIASEFSITLERTRQILAKAIRKIMYRRNIIFD